MTVNLFSAFKKHEIRDNLNKNFVNKNKITKNT